MSGSTFTPMPITSEPQGSAALNALPYGQDFATNWADKFTSEAMGASKELRGFLYQNAAKWGVTGEAGQQLAPPSGTADAEADQKQAAEERAQRESISQRYSGGTFGRITSSLAAAMLDPTNLATGLIPGFGEEAIAARFGTFAGRAFSGATGGMLGQVPLTALHATQDPDYGWASAATDLAAGGLLGAGLGDAIKAHGDRLDIPPSVDADARKTTAAALLDDRQVDVRPVLDAAPDSAYAGYRRGVEERVADLQARAAKGRAEAVGADYDPVAGLEQARTLATEEPKLPEPIKPAVTEDDLGRPNPVEDIARLRQELAAIPGSDIDHISAIDDMVKAEAEKRGYLATAAECLTRALGAG